MSGIDVSVSLIAAILGVCAGTGAVALGFKLGFQAGACSGELIAVKEHQRRRRHYSHHRYSYSANPSSDPGRSALNESRPSAP